LPLGLKLVREGVLTEDVLWRALTLNPAKIIGIDAGTLHGGGGVIVIDPEKNWPIAPENLISAGHNTPFLGMMVQGAVIGLWR
jgi:dihydroorotase